MPVLGIDLHKHESQVTVLPDDSSDNEPLEEVRVANANLDEIASRYAGSKAVIEATSKYYTTYDRLSEHLDVTVANPLELSWIAESSHKTDEIDAQKLAELHRADIVPESYVPPEEIRSLRAPAIVPVNRYNRPYDVKPIGTADAHRNMGLMSKILGDSESSRRTEDYVELTADDFQTEAAEAETTVRIARIGNQQDVVDIKDAVYDGDIVIADITRHTTQDQTMEHITDELKQVAQEVGGDIVQKDDDQLIITPSGVAISRERLGR